MEMEEAGRGRRRRGATRLELWAGTIHQSYRKCTPEVDEKIRGPYYHPLFRANFNHPTAFWSEDLNE
jgi:hypothetical protein